MTAEPLISGLCGDCGLPTDLLDVWTSESTDGPVEHEQRRCWRGHVRTTYRLCGRGETSW